MEKYYYENGEKCNYLEQNSDIGSPNCMECEFFKGVDLIENWCKCDIYSAFAEVELLKKENDSRFNYIVKLTKEIEDLKIDLENTKIQLKKVSA